MQHSARLATRVGLIALLLSAISSTAYATSYLATPEPLSFVNVTAVGTVLTGLTNQDDTAVGLALPFTFRFFDTDYTSLSVSSNGLITFGGGDTTFTNADLTTSPDLAAIAPFWDDLHTAGGLPGSDVYTATLGAPGSRQFVIQWNQIRFFSGGTAGDTITFEAVLFEGSNNIRFSYLDLISGSAAGNNGASATVGIKDAGTQGPNRLLLAFNNGPNAFVGSEHSTLLTRQSADVVPEPATLTLVGIGVLAGLRRRFTGPRK